MGWDVAPWQSKDEVVKEQAREGRFGPESKPLIIQKVRSGYWMLWEMTSPIHNGVKRRFIECGLVAKERGGGYALKWMTADEGPSYYDCPVAFLDVPGVSYSQTWAAEVRRRAEAGR